MKIKKTAGKGRGGRREGAGRKPLGAVARSFMVRIRITPAERRALVSESKRRGTTISDFLMRPFRQTGR